MGGEEGARGWGGAGARMRRRHFVTGDSRPRTRDPYAVAMTSPSRIFALAAATALLGLSLTACAGTDAATPTTSASAPAASDNTGPCETTTEGVTLIVDSSALEGGEVEQWCIPASADIAASDVLEQAGVDTEGTEEYGDQVVCRVDGEPAEDTPLTAEDGSEYSETCESMPAAFAYWGLWLKPADGEWDYAQEGISTLQVAPGDSLELLFSLNGQPAAPTS